MIKFNTVTVLFLLATAALARGDRIPREPRRPPATKRYYIHISNGLSNVSMTAHCQSKDDDLGFHDLHNPGDDYQWNFSVNFLGSTLFWCRLEKPGAYVSFEVFWPEYKHTWLRERCNSGTTEGTCIWTAKDDGIYLRNIPANVDEFVHKWIST